MQILIKYEPDRNLDSYTNIHLASAFNSCCYFTGILYMPCIQGFVKQMNGITQRIKRITIVNSVFLVLPSYILHYYLNVEVNSLFAVLGSVCLLVALHDSHWRLGRGVLMLVLSLCGIGVIGSIFSGVLSQLLMAISLSLSFVVASCSWSLLSDQRTLNYLMVIGWILVGGAVFAFFYAVSGGPPLAQIDLLGRDSYFYLTTFTNAVSGNLIRAAGNSS